VAHDARIASVFRPYCNRMDGRGDARVASGEWAEPGLAGPVFQAIDFPDDVATCKKGCEEKRMHVWK
jgi:hypothetical protein